MFLVNILIIKNVATAATFDLRKSQNKSTLHNQCIVWCKPFQEPAEPAWRHAPWTQTHQSVYPENLCNPIGASPDSVAVPQASVY